MMMIIMIMVVLVVMMMIKIRIMMTLKGVIRDFLQSPHCKSDRVIMDQWSCCVNAIIQHVEQTYIDKIGIAKSMVKQCETGTATSQEVVQQCGGVMARYVL